ncbi:MAG: hypothetical protein WA510_29595 [Acidobacteriaceae bacterium]
MAKRLPDDTLVESSYVPTVRALLALNWKDAAQAIDSLQVAVRFDLVIPPQDGLPRL